MGGRAIWAGPRGQKGHQGLSTLKTRGFLHGEVRAPAKVGIKARGQFPLTPLDTVPEVKGKGRRGHRHQRAAIRGGRDRTEPLPAVAVE